MSENLGESSEGSGESAGDRLNREAEEDMPGEEKTDRRREKELRDMRRLLEEMTEEVDKENRKHSQLFIENANWVEVFQIMVDRLKRKEEELERKYENIWQNRTQFCSEVDGFIRDLEKFTKSDDNAHDEETERRVREIQEEIKSLGLKITQKEVLLQTLDKNLKILEAKRMILLEESEGPEVTRVEEWIRITCEKCAELENQIAEKRRLINEKNADLIKSVRSKKNNLFSKVSLDHVKKLSPFKTDPKPSSSLNLSLD